MRISGHTLFHFKILMVFSYLTNEAELEATGGGAVAAALPLGVEVVTAAILALSFSLRLCLA